MRKQNMMHWHPTERFDTLALHVLIPNCLRLTVLVNMHRELLHAGRDRMTAALKPRVYRRNWAHTYTEPSKRRAMTVHPLRQKIRSGAGASAGHTWYTPGRLYMLQLPAEKQNKKLRSRHEEQNAGLQIWERERESLEASWRCEWGSAQTEAPLKGCTFASRYHFCQATPGFTECQGAQKWP